MRGICKWYRCTSSTIGLCRTLTNKMIQTQNINKKGRGESCQVRKCPVASYSRFNFVPKYLPPPPPQAYYFPTIFKGVERVGEVNSTRDGGLIREEVLI